MLRIQNRPSSHKVFSFLNLVFGEYASVGPTQNIIELNLKLPRMSKSNKTYIQPVNFVRSPNTGIFPGFGHKSDS